jgi:hypothetical protein
MVCCIPFSRAVVGGLLAIPLHVGWHLTPTLAGPPGNEVLAVAALLSAPPGGAHVEQWGYLGTTFAF